MFSSGLLLPDHSKITMALKSIRYVYYLLFFFCQVLFLSKQLEGTLHMLLAEMQTGVGIFNFEGDSAGLILIVDSQSLRMKSVCAVFFMSGNAISWL